MRHCTLALMLLAALTCRAWPQPSVVVAAAYADAKTLGKSQAYYSRYLDLSNIEPAAREDVYLTLCGHVQHLSTAPDRERPKLVPGTAGALLRIDIRDYNWSYSLWESLADADPFFHAGLITQVETKTVEKWPGGRYSDGIHYTPGAFDYYVVRKTQKKQTVHAPWLGDAKTVAALAKLTYSNVPIVRGDWFFWQTAVQQQRNPGYYDFLGIKDEPTFQAVVGFDKKLAKRFGDDLRSSVSRSGVTLQPRALLRQAALGGSLWKSFDFQIGTGDKNALRIFGKDIETGADATEQYGTLPNRFWATALFNSAGVRQDVAPNFIAGDSRSHSNDKQVHVNMSCVRCHVDGGLQGIKDFTRNLIRPPFVLNVEDYDRYVQLRREYLRSLKGFLEEDRARYARAVKEVTGWSTPEYARHYSNLWDRTENAEIDLERAARDLGCTPKHFRKALQIQIANGTADPVLGALLLEGDRRETIGFRQFQEVYGLAQAYLVGVKED